jgi:hypothetical protein
MGTTVPQPLGLSEAGPTPEEAGSSVVVDSSVEMIDSALSSGVQSTPTTSTDYGATTA